MYIMWGNIKRTQNPWFFSLGLMNHWDGTNQSWCHGSLTGSDDWISSQFVNIAAGANGPFRFLLRR